jgi:hypothetical protein
MLAFTPRFGAVLLLLVGSTAALAQSRVELSGPSAFSGILDTQARSRALFTEAAKVIMHPRCVNCHPASDRPTQGDDRPSAFADRSARQRWRRRAGQYLRRLSPRAQRGDFPGPADLVPEHSRPPPLAVGAGRDGVGRQIHRRDLPANQRSCCTSIWRMTIWSRGAGARDWGAIRFLAHRRCWANSFAPGSTAAPRVHEASIYTAAARSTFFAAPRAGTGRSRARANVRTTSRSIRPRISISWRGASPRSMPARSATASEMTSSQP